MLGHNIIMRNFVRLNIVVCINIKYISPSKDSKLVYQAGHFWSSIMSVKINYVAFKLKSKETKTPFIKLHLYAKSGPVEIFVVWFKLDK